MSKIMLPLLLFTLCLPVWAQPVTPDDSPIRVYRTDMDYDEVKSNLEMAITGQGMRITNTLHISEMLERTAADTGFEKKLYEHAESLEFCSIPMSYRMSAANPANKVTILLALDLKSLGLRLKGDHHGEVHSTIKAKP